MHLFKFSKFSIASHPDRGVIFSAGFVPQESHNKIAYIVHAVMDNDSSIYSKVVEFGNFHIINRLFPDGGD